MSTRSFHVGVSIRGALRNRMWSKFTNGSLSGCITVDGKKLSDDELFEFLCDHLTQGHEMLPVGECDNWCWKEGCQGHEKP